MLRVVLLSFIIGVFTGLSLRVELPSVLIDLSLAAMLFFIGYDLAASINFRKLKKLLFLSAKLALATVIGSVAAGYLVSLLLQNDTLALLAASIGMGWYSLTGALLLRFLGSKAGLLGFVANVLREILTFVFYPLFYRYAGTAAISMAGATSMDTTLPLIRKVSGRDAALISLIHGWIISSLVPILLMMLLSAVIS
ncbi:MAG: lysine exporter LysO family protein [Thermoprotei archaeon]|nr:MAG: lysine exporter LysO family protein [Thermoprotei archaeon]